jgi:SAM-dependent methyltransferase
MKPDDPFLKEKITKILTEKKQVIDIGGGLRVDPTRNNRATDKSWAIDLVKKTDYKILDKIADYNPDIVGDIHNLPFADNSIDAIICIAVLEHVEEPQLAAKEMFRVLKPGGYCFIHVPFLFYYHPMKGYYKDFFRFTRDGLEYMLRDFKHIEISNERGALATVMNLLPIFTKRTKYFEWLDRIFHKDKSNQTSAYNVFCIK